MPEKKPKKLIDLIIDESSFVDRGANPGAKILLFKQDAANKAVAGVLLVIGFVSGGGSKVQSVLFNRKQWSLPDARKWLKDNDFKVPAVDSGPNFHRFRQEDPKQFDRFRIIKPGQKAKSDDADGFNLEEVEEYLKAGETKTEDGVKFSAAAYAYVPDLSKPSLWKLRLWQTPQLKETARQVGMAVAALGPGFRGQKVQIPASDLPRVKAKVRAAWLRTHSGSTRADLPTVLKVKIEDGTGFPAEAYALVKNPDDPASWYLRLWSDPERDTIAAHLVGKALRDAAFHLCTDAAVIERVTNAWQSVSPEAVDRPAILKTKEGGPDTMDMQELEKRLADSEAQIKKLTDDVKAADDARIAAEAKATKAEQEGHVAALSEGHQKAFAAFSAEEQKQYFKAEGDVRQKMLTDKAKGLAKAAEVPEAIQKQLDAAKEAVTKANVRAEAAEKVAKEEAHQRQRANFAKKAEEAYPYLPGKPDEKGDALMALSDLPEAARTTVNQMLAAGNAALKTATKPAGTRGTAADADGDKGDTWEAKAKAYAEKHNVSVEKATDIVLKENPDLYTEYLKAKEG